MRLTVFLIFLLLVGCLGQSIRISPSGGNQSLPQDSLQAFSERFRFNEPQKLIFDDSKVVVLTGESGKALLREIDQTDDDASLTGFGGGEMNNCVYSDNALTLNSVDGAGIGTATYVSRLFDAAHPVDWKTLFVLPKRPILKELPNSLQIEKNYPLGNLDMGSIQNISLLHFNESRTEGADTLFDDDSGHGFHASCLTGTQCPSITPSGLFNSAARFDSPSGQYLKINPSASLGGTQEFSVAFWVKTTAAAIQYIAGQTIAGNNRVWLLRTEPCAVAGVGCVYFHTYQNDYNILLRSRKEVADGKWHHIVASRRKFQWDTGAYRWQGTLHIDGVKDSETPLKTTATDLNASIPIYIGTRDTSAGRTGFFTGELDEFAVFGQALSDENIWDIYTRAAQLRYQVRSCDETTTCNTQPFLGPDGTQGTAFSELPNTASGPAQYSLTLPASRFFQYKIQLETPPAAYSLSNVYQPSLKSVSVGAKHFAAESAIVEHALSYTFSQLTSFGEVATGNIRYQLGLSSSNNSAECNSPVWFYYDGKSWVRAQREENSNTASEIASQITSFKPGPDWGRLCLRAYLLTNGDETSELSQVSVNGMR